MDAPSGFNFDLAHRNALLMQEQESGVAGTNLSPLSMMMGGDPSMNGGGMPSTVDLANSIKERAKKTGTTVAGLIYKDGVIIGADSRATSGDEIADKVSEKILPMAPNIYFAGSGGAADLDKTAELMRSQLELLRMETHAQTRMVTAVTHLKRMLYRYQGAIVVGLVLGGVDVTGAHIYEVTPHGFTAKAPFAAEGSGTLAAISVLEAGWRENLPEAEAVTLLQRAILAGIYNDTASGSSCNICILRLDGTVDHRRNAVPGPTAEPLRNNVRTSNRFNMRSGLTPILSSTYTPHPPPTSGGLTLADVDVEMVEG